MNKRAIIIVWLCTLCLGIVAQQDMEKSLQRSFIMAEDGETITIAEGTFSLKGSLWMDGKKNITIKGQGMDKTILSFSNQTEGAEGIKITHATNITIEDLTIQDAKGDAIKTQEVEGITFRNVKTEWTGKPNKKNGAYGLYPVQCSNVLIEHCEAIGASDAGIYVGQSHEIIVRNCRAYQNVAGIEIENSTNADVYENEATANTGGILVFDLPGLVKKKGGQVRIFNNKIIENNYQNFAPKGNMVAIVPPGTGVMILATSNVEVFDNEIINNKTIGTSIISYYITELPIDDDAYDPYPTSIYIHDNTFEREKRWPTLKGKFGKLLWWKFGKKVPSIIYDGILNKELVNESGSYNRNNQICIVNNRGASFANLDATNGFKNLNTDISKYNCELQQLPEVGLNK
jgi:parallel beta-helix repeat protein